MDEEVRNTDVLQNTPDQSPENLDVDGLYARVNLEGSSYRDFSQAREQARLLSRRTQELKSHKSTGTLPAAPASLAKLSQMKPRGVPSAARKTPHTPEESPRWAALKNVIAAPDTTAAKVPRLPVPVQASTLILCSFAGGVGKTMLAASLGRSLAVLGERVLLVETHSYSLLPFYFGAREAGTDELCTLHCGESSPPLSWMTSKGSEYGRTEGLAERVAAQAEGMDYLLIDVATGSREQLREALRIPATVLALLTPDMASVVSLEAIHQFFEELKKEFQDLPEPHFILNQFDPSMRLHLDIRNALSAQLGKRLLPLALHRSSSVSEALAEGMSVQQYAPSSQIVNDLERLTDWLRDSTRNAVQKDPPAFRRERSCN